MRSCLLPLCLMLAAFAGPLRAAGFELNGRALGERMDQVLADERYDCGGASACFLFTACSYKAVQKETLYGVPLRALTLYYLGERVAAMEARFNAESFDAVVAATVREHGPAQIDPAQVDHRAGSAVGNAVYLWRQGRRLLRLERVFEGGDSSLIVTEQSLLGELLPDPP